jgi:hypothetical protein
LACHVLSIRGVGAYHHGKGVSKGATQILLKTGTLTIVFEKFNCAI